jgi:hypothetical protein
MKGFAGGRKLSRHSRVGKGGRPSRWVGRAATPPVMAAGEIRRQQGQAAFLIRPPRYEKPDRRDSRRKAPWLAFSGQMGQGGQA